MNENLKRLKPREKVDLYPRLFRQVLNPFKPVGNVFPFDDDRSSSVALHTPYRCKATFFDNVNKRVVVMDLGHVWLNCRFSYRAASSDASESTHEADLSRVDGAAPYENVSANSVSPGACEDGTELAEISPGTYVIPGQSPTDWTNQC